MRFVRAFSIAAAMLAFVIFLQPTTRARRPARRSDLCSPTFLMLLFGEEAEMAAELVERAELVVQLELDALDRARILAAAIDKILDGHFREHRSLVASSGLKNRGKGRPRGSISYSRVCWRRRSCAARRDAGQARRLERPDPSGPCPDRENLRYREALLWAASNAMARSRPRRRPSPLHRHACNLKRSLNILCA